MPTIITDQHYLSAAQRALKDGIFVVSFNTPAAAITMRFRMYAFKKRARLACNKPSPSGFWQEALHAMDRVTISVDGCNLMVRRQLDGNEAEALATALQNAELAEAAARLANRQGQQMSSSPAATPYFTRDS